MNIFSQITDHSWFNIILSLVSFIIRDRRDSFRKDVVFSGGLRKKLKASHIFKLGSSICVYV